MKKSKLTTEEIEKWKFENQLLKHHIYFSPVEFETIKLPDMMELSMLRQCEEDLILLMSDMQIGASDLLPLMMKRLITYRKNVITARTF